MNRVNRKISKVALLAVAAVLAVLLIFAIVLLADWPPWVAIFLALLLLGGALGFMFLRQFWLRRFEHELVDDMVQQAEGPKDDAAGRARKLEELHSQWKKAIATLRTSDLKKHGNPLYVLPWYLLIGTSGAGKTTLLANAAVPSPLQETTPEFPAAATRNCDWWFFNEAVAIDTTGRYAVHLDEEADKEEWRLFLRLLVKYRGREPLNGVIVTVPVDRLHTADGDLLAEDGAIIRHRLNDMMSVLGIKFPVYLLITKCDLIPGMGLFTELLPESSRKEAVGVVNTDLAGAADGFVDGALCDLSRRLAALRLGMLLSSRDEKEAGQLVALPDELSRLKKKIADFAGPAFGSNKYQETPILRGIFLSSGQPHQPPQQPAGENDLARFRKAAFLHDLFTTILPQDRWISTPTRRMVAWQRATSNLGVVSWVILLTAMCGLLTFSFVKNLSTLRRLPPELSAVPQLRGDLSGDLQAMDNYRRVIAVVEERNRHWLIPRFGLNATLDLEEELKRRFCRKYHEAFLAAIDRQLHETVAGLSVSASDERYGEMVVHLARRINVLKAWRRGEGDERLAALPQPDFTPLMAQAAADGKTREKGAACHLCCLSWHANRSEIERDLARLANELRTLVALKRGNSQWLVSWVNRQGRIAPVTLSEFWGGSRNAAGEPAVAPAFTRKGKEEIDSIVREVKAALEDRQSGPIDLGASEKGYRSQRLAAWEAFLAGFPRGVERLKGEHEWQETAARMVTDKAPHFMLLDRLVAELQEEGEERVPSWLHQARLGQTMKNNPVARNAAIAKAAERGKKLIASLEGREGGGGSKAEEAVAGSAAFAEYRAALAAIAPAIASRMQAHQAAAQLYGDDPVAGKSPFLAAAVSSKKVTTALAGNGTLDPKVGKLVAGPVDYLWAFARKEAAVHLQSQWEEQVLGATLGLTGQQAAPALLGQDGLVWKFVRGPAAPFLSRSLKGYRAKEVLGGCLLFEEPFLCYLQRGAVVQAAVMAKQSNYAVGIQGIPTDSNADAGVRPHATRLELQCGASTQTLTNLNYPTGKTFNWSPDGCGDVTLQIEVGDLVLTRRYSGPQAFPDFLESFPGGRRTFYPRDFPGERGALEKMGIRYIKVNYRMIGSGPVVKLKASGGGQQPPSRITKCWE